MRRGEESSSRNSRRLGGHGIALVPSVLSATRNGKSWRFTCLLGAGPAGALSGSYREPGLVLLCRYVLL